MRNQIDRWEKEEQQGVILFAQNLERKLKATETKLDTLINAFLEGLVDKNIYLKKKEALINEKQTLKDEKASFGQKGLLWVEPLRNWVEVPDRAGKLSLSNEIHEIKSIFEKSGTNRVLRDKKIGVEFLAPYSDLNNYKGFGGIEDGKGSKNKKGELAKNTNSPTWWAQLESNQPPTDYESVALTE